MKADTEKWLSGLGERFLVDIGLCRGQTVLDFGCGAGAYAIPAAKVVGDEGRIYAQDKSQWSLNQARARAKSLHLENIEFVHSSGELQILLEDESVDVILLYDVIHSWYFSSITRKELLREVYRVSRPDALISVYPSHMDLKNARRELEDAGFRLKKQMLKTVLHNGRLVKDYVLNFRKQNVFTI